MADEERVPVVKWEPRKGRAKYGFVSTVDGKSVFTVLGTAPTKKAAFEEMKRRGYDFDKPAKFTTKTKPKEDFAQ